MEERDRDQQDVNSIVVKIKPEVSRHGSLGLVFCNQTLKPKRKLFFNHRNDH
jgi:hypothetical protein